jgi:hypothetical protein
MVQGADEGRESRSCQWCGTLAPAGAATCEGCGAGLGQREDLGGVVIPGVTSVDPVLQAYDAQPLRIPRSSPTQGLAGGTLAAAAMGGPVGLAALGGLAAVAAVEYLGAKSGGSGDLQALGTPSEAALQMVKRLSEAVVEGADPADPTDGGEGQAVRDPEDGLAP